MLGEVTLGLAAVLLDVGRQTLAPSVGEILEVCGQWTGEEAGPEGEAWDGRSREPREGGVGLEGLGSLQEQHLQAGGGGGGGGGLQASEEDVVHILRISFRTYSVPETDK